MTPLKAALIILSSTLTLYSGRPAKKFVPDDFPVTNKMFAPFVKSDGRVINSGNIISGDKAWFANDSLHQTLVFDLYTDYFRMNIFFFDNNNIPRELIKIMELNTSDGSLATDKQKEKALKGFVKQARWIKSKYFTSDKGISLGSDRVSVLKAYGRPDKASRTDSLKMLEWDFTGDSDLDTSRTSKHRRVAADSFGHHITAFFKEDKLVALILQNDIP